MKYKPYDEYEDSGIEWIGDIPVGWEVGKTGHFYLITLGKMLSPNPVQDTDTFEYYLCSVNLNFDGLKTDLVKQMWFSADEKKRYRLIKGDLIVAEGGDAGVCCFWNNEIESCYIQNAVHRVRANKKSNNRYLYYWLYFSKHIGYIDLICNKATIAHYTKDKFSNSPMVLPTILEQVAIADYLDNETAKIIKIISTKQKLIEKLQEKRSAIISHTVTKGLDPNAKMKPSGIAWIGDIPEGWEVKKLKYIAKLKTGTTPPSDNEEYFDGLFNWYTPADFSDEYILNESNRKISTLAVEDGLVPIYPTDSILIVGIGATLGKIGITMSASSSNQQITAIITISEVYSKFIMYWLASIIEYIKNTANFTTLPILNNQALGDVLCNIPRTFEEQKSISDFLDAETAKIDAIIAKTKSSIEKLNEYKTALISACVTGKIDVRGE